jgi:hypothetical protein
LAEYGAGTLSSTTRSNAPQPTSASTISSAIGPFIRLSDEELLNPAAEALRVLGCEGVIHVHEGDDAAALLRSD